MDWRDEGILLAVRKHGESAAIIEVFTPSHGRHAGVVHGGTGRKMAPLLQPGAQLDVTWRARLEEHLGTYSVELVRGRAGEAMASRATLAGLAAVTALAAFVLPERQAYAQLYGQTHAVLDLICTSEPLVWAYGYLRWEAALLAEMGFGLDLERCAVSGTTEGLIYVSPRTGRAVSGSAAGEWADKLLPLVPCLRGEPPKDMAEVLAGLETTGWFLAEKLAPSLGEKPLPASRARLLAALARLD